MTDMNMIPQNIEAEQSVLGGMMLDSGSDRCQTAMSMLKPESFYIRPHQVIFAEMRELAANQKPIDLITLIESLESKGLGEQAGGFAYMAEISKNTPSAANIVHYAMLVREKAMERYGIDKLNSATELLYSRNGMTTSQKFDAIQTLFTDIADYAKTGNRRGLREFSEVMGDWVDEVEARWSDSDATRGLSTGIGSLDDLLQPKGLVKGALMVIGARPKMGKAQPLDSRILLADGSWTTFRDVSAGDALASVDGQPSVVSGVFPQGERDIYRVTFSDGRTVDCADDHLWEIHSSRIPGGADVVDTCRLRDMMECVRYQNRIHVPGISGDFGLPVDLGISPWLLGALLGDGNLAGTPRISMTEPYIIERVRTEVGDDIEVRHVSGCDYSLSHKFSRKLSLTRVMQRLGVYGRMSEIKLIPDIIFSADKQTRIDVLCGLLETDGWVEGNNALRFSSASKFLSDDVKRLVHSLGGVCRMTTKQEPKFSYKGEIRKGLDAHICAIRLPDEVLAHIQSPRLKQKLTAKRIKTSAPVITSVEYAGRKECVCIMVSHERHLYATDGYILTHNTTLYSQLAINCAEVEKLPALMFSLEMSDKQIAERMIGQASGVNTDVFYADRYDDTQVAMAFAAGGRLAQSGNLYVDDTPGITLAHVVAESRRIKRERGAVGMVMVDYLTLMTADKADRNDLAYGIITKGLKNLAKELNCIVVLLTQLNRDLEKRTNKRPTSSDSRETGQIEQDCDYWLGIYREGFYDENADQAATELLLRLNRHGPTGVVYCDQRNGAIYDCDQAAAEQKRRANDARTNNKRDF
ncbi:TPA: AAA family ATPase [Citrobacter freundii]|nr:AAA family ATPase [Citrobacter freundii]